MVYEINGVYCYQLPNSPSISDEGKIYQFRCVRGDGEKAFQNLFHASYYTFGVGLSGWLDKKRSGVASDGVFDTLTLSLCYTQPDGLNAHAVAVPEKECKPTTTNMQKPIETHPNYRTNWNYDLYCYVPKGGTSQEPPEWWETAVNLSDADGITWTWDKTRPSKDDKGHWELSVPRTKPGVEDYLYPAPTIIETVYYSTKKEAKDNLLAVGMMKAPFDAYPYSSDDQKWIVNRSEPDKRDRYWCVVSEYIYASNGWDADLYNIYTKPERGGLSL